MTSDNTTLTVQTFLATPASHGGLFVKIVLRRVFEERRVAHVHVSSLLVAQFTILSLRSVRRGPVIHKKKPISTQPPDLYVIIWRRMSRSTDDIEIARSFNRDSS